MNQNISVNAIVNVIRKFSAELAPAQQAARSGCPADMAVISLVAIQLQAYATTKTTSIPTPNSLKTHSS